MIGGQAMDELLRIRLQCASWVLLGDRLRTLAPVEYERVESSLRAFLAAIEAEHAALARLKDAARDIGYSGFTGPLS